MSDSSINDFDQDYVFIDTKVTIGRSFKSRGWALSRIDIHDWIPVEKFEKNCKVIINNISADAVLRFNPRLFYKSDELSDYLKELYDKGCSKYKIPMKIKVNKKNFYSNIDSNVTFPNFIDTKLKVGKSFSSGGWQLSKDVVAMFFPSEEYSGQYSIYINDICSSAILNTQFRLFYKSDELSNYLEELYYVDENNKISAKIVFECDSSFINEKISKKEEILGKSEEENRSLDTCSFCGKLYDVEENFLDEDNQFLNLCPACIEKIFVLRAFNTIKNSSLSSFIKKEFVKDKFDSNFDEVWELLIKYDFLTPIGDLYKLNGNEHIENNYSKYITEDSIDSKPESKKRNRDKILELIDDDVDVDEGIPCVICGSILEASEIEKCSICSDKSLATEYLHDIVTKVPYDKNFTRVDLLDLGIDSVEADLFIDKLLKYNLILEKSDIFYKLNDVDILNQFIGKYSDSPYELQINYVNDNSNILKISKKDLSSEEKIDSLITWTKFMDYVSFKKGQYGFLTVQFKQDGNFMYSKRFSSSYEAKIESINYLKALGKLEIITDKDIKLEFK